MTTTSLTPMQRRVLSAIKNADDWISSLAVAKELRCETITVRSCVAAIRQKLGERAGIETDTGNRDSRGYRYLAPLPWRSGGVPPEAEAIEDSTHDGQTMSAAAQGSRDLLRALLRFGLRHDSDLGLGAKLFYQRCAEVGLMVVRA